MDYPTGPSDILDIDEDDRAQCSRCGIRFNTGISGYEDTTNCGRCWDKINMEEE